MVILMLHLQLTHVENKEFFTFNCPFLQLYKNNIEIFSSVVEVYANNFGIIFFKTSVYHPWLVMVVTHG